MTSTPSPDRHDSEETPLDAAGEETTEAEASHTNREKADDAASPDVEWRGEGDDSSDSSGEPEGDLPEDVPTSVTAVYQPPEDPTQTLEERRELLAGQLTSLSREALLEEFAARSAAEFAVAIEELEPEQQLEILRALPDAAGSDVFDFMEPDDQVELLSRMRLSRAKFYLNRASPDVRADMFGLLKPEQVSHFLALLPRAEQDDLRELLKYDDETAGGIMTTDFAWLEAGETVAQALDRIRTEFKNVEMLYYLYVLDEQDRLLGLVTLRYLMVSAPDALIGDLMTTPVVFLHPEEDQEVVARELAIYDFYAMPIVDHGGKMLGIVTFDDVVDVVENEAVEDQELFGGMAPSEDDYVDQTVWQAVKQRFPWLALFLVLSSGSGFVITWFGAQGYTGEKPFFIYVFALLPMIAAMAGNAATQTATLVIRAISIRDVTTRNALEVIGRELKLGVLMGVLLGVLAFFRAMLASGEYAYSLGIAVTSSIVAVMGVATVTGAAMPMFFKRLGFDPAVMSSPLIATVIDIVTITLYLAISVAVYISFIAPNAV